MGKIKGCIFDMDGLLIDTEKLYNRFWREAARDFDYEMTYEDCLKIRGMGHSFSEKLLKESYGKEFPFEDIMMHRRELMQAFIDEEGVEIKPGARELLQFLKENGYKAVVATSSPLERTENFLGQLGILCFFDAITCGPEVEHGKPAPDIFLLAAEKIGVPPEECMVLEDSPNGILAAFRAGSRPVMVPDLSEPDEETEKLLYAKAESLTEVITLLRKDENEG